MIGAILLIGFIVLAYDTQMDYAQQGQTPLSEHPNARLASTSFQSTSLEPASIKVQNVLLP